MVEDSEGVYESGELSKKIYGLGEEIKEEIAKMKAGTLTDVVGFMNKIKNYKVVAQTWNRLYIYGDLVGFDENEYDEYIGAKPVDKPKRIF